MLDILTTRLGLIWGISIPLAIGGCGLDQGGLCPGDDGPCAAQLPCEQTGTCLPECVPGWIRCGDVCTDPMSDVNFCGAKDKCQGANAGVVCTEGQVCVEGACSAACPAGQVKCGLSCVNTATSPVHCGGCDMSCPLDPVGGSYACEDSQCVFYCFPGLKDSNNYPPDGCENHDDMIFWLDASTVVNKKDGDAIDVWQDRSGWGRDAVQNMVGNRPKYRANIVNGKPALGFNSGQKQFMEVPVITLFETGSAELTVGVVFRASTPNTRGFLLSHWQSACSSELNLGYHVSLQNRPNLGIRTECGGATVMQENIGQDTWYRAVFTVHGTGSAPVNVRMTKNGVEQTLVSEDGGWTSAGMYGTGIANAVIGARWSGGQHIGFNNGLIAEMLVIRRAINTKEQEILNKYWINKYGVF